jgi:hypothetical protein
MGFIDEIAVYNRALSASEINDQIASASSGLGICNETVTALVNDPSSASFILFPVPARDVLYIKLNNIVEDIKYEIFNINGMIMGSGIIPAKSQIANIPVHNLQPGVYNIRYSNQRINSNENFMIR